MRYIVKARPSRHKWNRKALLSGRRPLRMAIVTKVLDRVTPKKPHSGLRKAVKFDIKYKKRLKNRAYLMGIGAKELLSKHFTIFFRGGRRKDIPAMKYTAVYGVRTKNNKTTRLMSLPGRIRARSKYGIMRPSAPISREAAE